MSFMSDWRSGLRLFARQPGLAASAVVALALGVGLTTLLFSIAYGIFLRGLPVPDGGRIMAVSMANVATGRQRLPVTIHDFTDWRRDQRTFDDLAAFQTASFNVTGRDGKPERLAGSFITENGFDLLRTRPLIGRTLTAGDGTPDAAPVLVLGYGVWETRFGSDPQVVGRIVRANGQPTTIVGVMPKGFAFPSSQEAWMPLRADPLEIPRGDGPSLVAYGRLKAAASIAQAQADLGAIGARLAADHPRTNRSLTPVVRPYTDMMVSGGDAVVAMALTLGTGFGVLLIACANVANLLFARAASRTREVAIRSALGASGRRIIMQHLAEATALATVGTAVGLLIAGAGIDVFNRAVVDTSPPFWVDVRLDGASLAFAAALTALAALMSGGLPAWRASRPDVNEMLKDGARSAGGLRIGRFSRILIAAEIVLSFGLLNAAGLMMRSIINLGAHEYGFAMDDVFTARIVLPETAHGDARERNRFLEALQARLSAIPGIESATLATAFPGLSADRTPISVEAVVNLDPSLDPVVRTAAIAPHFFETFGRAVARGRAFTAADTAGAPGVALVNASFASRYLEGADPIGRRVRLGRDEASPWLTIVGVAPDMYMSGAENPDPAGVYVPVLQSPARSIGMALRGPGARMAPAAPVRALVAALDPDLPVFFSRTLRQAIDDSLWAFVVFGPLLVAVGLAALFLSAVGLYSLMAFAARQRTREIGLRRAIGAGPSDIVRLVAGEVAGQLGAGLLAGAGLAWWISGVMRTMVFHVEPRDPLIFLSIVVTLVGTGAIAAFLPARRATRVAPTVALRDQ